MIKIENVEVLGWESAIRGLRNPLNSWDKSDSHYCNEDCPMVEYDHEPAIECNNGEYGYCIGANDLNLMNILARAGSDHAKYRRMITVYLDITAPLYWWKEFDTYKVGTVANSCSTMHKIHDKEFTLEEFSYEHLGAEEIDIYDTILFSLNWNRCKFIETKDKTYWWKMIQLLPSSYNQKRTVLLNYEVLANMYKSRKNHKLDEWREFCEWIASLPYSEIITGGK